MNVNKREIEFNWIDVYLIIDDIIANTWLQWIDDLCYKFYSFRKFHSDKIYVNMWMPCQHFRCKELKNNNILVWLSINLDRMSTSIQVSIL